MNRLLWPTELHRHSKGIISSGWAAVKGFWQKNMGTGTCPIDGSESQFVHLRRAAAAGTVEAWRGSRRKILYDWVRWSIWWNPAALCGRPRCARAAAVCTRSVSRIPPAASGSGRTGSSLPAPPPYPICTDRNPVSRS